MRLTSNQIMLSMVRGMSQAAVTCATLLPGRDTMVHPDSRLQLFVGGQPSQGPSLPPSSTGVPCSLIGSSACNKRKQKVTLFILSRILFWCVM
jgi:hypothetical protein